MKLLLKQQGFSLLEILVASFISLLLLSGMITLYLSSQENYRLQQALLNMQEHARLALHVFETELRTAGYIGCPRFDDIFYKHYVVNRAGYDIKPDNVIRGFHANGQLWQPALPNHLNHVIKPNSDMLSLKKFSTQTSRLLAVNTLHNRLYVSAESRIKKNQFLIVSDCNKAEIVAVKNVRRSKGRWVVTLKGNMKYSFDKLAIVSPWQLKRFFIKLTVRKNRHGQAISALYQEGMNGRDEELISGISQLRLYFAERMKNKRRALSFVTADQVVSWRKVVAVKIDLLLASEEEVARQPQTYSFSGQQYKASDRRLHQQWSTIVALRERL